MTIREVYRHRRTIICLLILPLCIFLLDLPLEARPRFQDKPEVRNISLELQEEIAIISYDLVAPFGESYEVTAALVKDNDPSFRVEVKSATGDIGTGKFAGFKRQIQWQWKKDLPKDFAGGTGYSVEVSAIQVNGGGSSWLYYVLGGALIAGGAFAFAGKKSGSNQEPVTTPLPSSPPGRPF